VKVRITPPKGLLAFADEEARRRGTSRSGLLTELLEAGRLREQTARYIDRQAGMSPRTRKAGAITSGGAWRRSTATMSGEAALPRRCAVW
jgi:hypothetical protein